MDIGDRRGDQGGWEQWHSFSSASVTALQKADGEKGVKKKIHFLNLVSLTDPGVKVNREAAGCDKLFSASSARICLPLRTSLALSWERKRV